MKSRKKCQRWDVENFIILITKQIKYMKKSRHDKNCKYIYIYIYTHTHTCILMKNELEGNE